MGCRWISVVGLGILLSMAAVASAVDIGRWNAPDLGLGVSRDLVRRFLASPDAVADGLWIYDIAGSREIVRGVVGFSAENRVVVAAQLYRPDGVNAATLVELLRRQGLPLTAGDDGMAFLAGADPRMGQGAFFVVLSPDDPSRGPVLLTLGFSAYRTLRGEGSDGPFSRSFRERLVAWIASPKGSLTSHDY